MKQKKVLSKEEMEGWVNTGHTFADLLIFKKGNKRRLVTKQNELYHEYQENNKYNSNRNFDWLDVYSDNYHVAVKTYKVIDMCKNQKQLDIAKNYLTNFERSHPSEVNNILVLKKLLKEKEECFQI